MLSTIEKIIFLKGVQLFQEMSSEQLTHIAQIATEIMTEKHEILITEGDIGDALYIVIDGKMRIHKGDVTIVMMGAREPIGEMGILDSAPRSASVTAEQDTRLLKIEREAFNELLSDHIEIARGVIQVLLHRLRQVSSASAHHDTPTTQDLSKEPARKQEKN